MWNQSGAERLVVSACHAGQQMQQLFKPDRHFLQSAAWQEPATVAGLTGVSLLWYSCEALPELLLPPSSRYTL